jgi:hypothetical protein
MFASRQRKSLRRLEPSRFAASAITFLLLPLHFELLRSMAGWVHYSRGRLVYPGRITRGPFRLWAETPGGRAAIDAAVSHTRFSLIGKRRSATRRLWRQLADLARESRVASIINDEAYFYLERLNKLAFADALPCRGVDLRRLVVVPNALLNGAAYTAVKTRLRAEGVCESLEGGDAVVEFFIRGLIRDMQAATESAQPSPGRPLVAGSEWMTVGVNPTFGWLVPLFEDPPWNGHHYVLEVTRHPMTRSLRKAISARITQLEEALAALSRSERSEIMRRAAFGR